MDDCATTGMRFETGTRLALEAAFDGGRITSDGGLVWLARADSELALCERVAEHVPEWRKRKGRHSLEALVKQRVFQIACGYEDQNDSNSLREDPLLKLLCGSMPHSGADLASQPTISRLENAPSAGACYRMAQALFELYLEQRGKDGTPEKILLDFDSTADPTHGDQEGSYYHGYYEQHMYHPLLVFDGQSGHLICALLRAGNTHGSNSAVALLKRIVARVRNRWPEAEIELRADAGFAVPALYDYCEREGITYTVGLITNPRLEELAGDLLEEAKRRYGDQPEPKEKVKLFREGRYQAGSWEHERRVVYKAEVMEQGTNTRFLVSTRKDGPKDLYEFYVKRVLREARRERELDQGLQTPRKSRPPELPALRGQPVQAALARLCLLVVGHLEEEAGGKRSAADATGHFAFSSHQDRWEGQRAYDESPHAPGLRASRTKFMARSLDSLWRRS